MMNLYYVPSIGLLLLCVFFCITIFHNEQRQLDEKFHRRHFTFDYPSSSSSSHHYRRRRRLLKSHRGRTSSPSKNNNENNNDNRSDDTSNNDSSSSSSNNNNNFITVIIEGDVKSLFFCSSCTEELQLQQDSILQNLTNSFNNLEVLATTHRLANAIFVRFQLPNNINFSGSIDDEEEEGEESEAAAIVVFQQIRQIHGVQNVYPHEIFQLNNFHYFDPIAAFLGSGSGGSASSSNHILSSKFCVTGKNVRIAVLDTGIDYTHKNLGGPGTKQAYRTAFGSSSSSSSPSGSGGGGGSSSTTTNEQQQQPQQHTILDGELFPNDVIVDGFDFLGEGFQHTMDSTPDEAKPDPDPIDATPGHGTAVADAMLQVAPDAKLIALKVCTSKENSCPEFAITQALEYALDPKGDGSREGMVDIINLSLGLPHFNPYYDFISKLLEEVFHLGVVPVVAFGNHGNHIPFVAGFASIAPSAISVGSTQYEYKYFYDKKRFGPTIAEYSARGPGYANGMIKPDLVAPAGLPLAASGSGTGRWASVTGTSFSAPLVSGGIALLKEKCGEVCSPFALKSLLMNNANRNVRYSRDTSQQMLGAPVSTIGAGELQLFQALNASYWAYSVEDVQPSISLGVIDVASDMNIKRTLRINNLARYDHLITFSSTFRDPAKAESNALTIEFEAEQVLLEGSANCDDATERFVDINIWFRLHASRVPPNHMASAGKEAYNATLSLDKNEFGGHVILHSKDSDTSIGLPFMAIIRQASNVTMEAKMLGRLESVGTTDVYVGLTNHGAGVSQIDSYQVMSFGDDSSESTFGDRNEKVDLRTVGYRVLTPHSKDCTYLFEWVFQTWEIQDRLQSTMFEVQIDVDEDYSIDYYVFNSGLGSLHTSRPGEILVRNAQTGDVHCTGLHADHHTFSTVSVLRVCSDDLGITEPGSMVAQARVVAIRYDGSSETTDRSPFASFLTYPDAELSAPSYDLPPGETLDSIELSHWNKQSRDLPPLGLVLVTDAFRRAESTGAALHGTETQLLLADIRKFGLDDDLFIPSEEKTKENRFIPPASNLKGPDCSWEKVCSSSTTLVESAMEKGEGLPIDFVLSQNVAEIEEAPSCPQVEIPRAAVPTRAPSPSPLQTTDDTAAPTEVPTQSLQTPVPTDHPTTLAPSYGPSNNPFPLPSMNPTITSVPSKTAIAPLLDSSGTMLPALSDAGVAPNPADLPIEAPSPSPVADNPHEEPSLLTDATNQRLEATSTPLVNTSDEMQSAMSDVGPNPIDYPQIDEDAGIFVETITSDSYDIVRPARWMASFTAGFVLFLFA